MTNLQKQIELLTEGQAFKIIPQGTSMCPFFFGARDEVYVTAPRFPLKKGDIPVFQRTDGTYVIHRICRIQKTSRGVAYYMLGDNQTWIEGPIYESQIHAVTVQIKRKGKLIDCRSNQLYRLASMLWLFLRPVRPAILSAQKRVSRNRK